MKKALLALAAFLIPIVLLFLLYLSAFWGFTAALELAVKDHEIFYNGKVYSVEDTGITYPMDGE